MEPTEVIIARLVLGYLREEKCRSAYKEFLKTSQYLESDLSTKSKYLPTRFVGLTLSDILCEYFEVSKIVQGRLEATSYYTECHSKSSLVHQLLYLLNKVQSSRTSTPCPRSPLESNLDETSPSHIDHVSDVETTPAHTLPGNIRCTSEDSYLYKTPRRKSSSKLSKSVPVSNLQLPEPEDMSKVLANTLMENKEFHEKIAQTINKVAEKQYRVSSELDRTIKTVVKETEADPIFDKILEDIIGSSSAMENCKGVDTSSTTSSREESRNKSKRAQKRLNSDNSEDTSDQTAPTHPNPQSVEQQNDEAIRSIVANSNLNPNSQANTQEIHVNNEVTVFNGSLDKYLTTNTCHANTQTQPLQNPLYINTGGLLMVPSGISSSGSLQIDSTKQYYLVNKQPTTNWSVPPIQSANILTEQDILAMPTVIVSEERPSKSSSAPVSKASTVNTTQKLIIPKPMIEIAPDFLKAFNECQQHQRGLKNVVYPKTVKKTKTDGDDPSPSNATNAVKSLSNLLEPDVEDKTVVEANASKESGHLTPPPVAERIQKTPKSGSHVRNLDFTTPPKITSTHRKPFRSKIDSHALARKRQAAKNALRKSKLANADETSTAKERRTWDADLRANITLPEEEEEEEAKVKCNAAKKKRKTPVRRVKKKAKPKVGRKRLNSTEENAARIEAALKTPLKTDKRNGADAEPTNDCKSENCNNEKENSIVATSEIDGDLKQENAGNLDLPRDPTECNKIKTVLSPSKLNASKRKLIKSDVSDAKPEDEANKFITPEMVKDNFHYPIKANRNISSLFDTPLKNEFPPKTPGSPSLCTPFTKILEENLKGIDISSLPTPNIPITPNFPPFTPTVDILSPYSNRPTDYSTSSSYYHPSDSEPNRSLEANVIEMEKQAAAGSNDTAKGVDKTDKVDDKNERVKCVSNVIKERLKIFNENVIGKKNLSLVKRNIQPNSSSSESSSESSNEEDNGNSSDWVDKSNETVIYNRKPPETPKRTYSLRNRTTTVRTEDVMKTMEVKESNKLQTHKNVRTSVKSREKSVDKQICVINERSVEINYMDNTTNVQDEEDRKLLAQQALKKELNEKLSRTMAKIKTEEKSTKKSAQKPKKNPKAKFNFRIDPRNIRKGASPKKIVDKGMQNSEKSTKKDLEGKQEKVRKKGGRGKKDGITAKKAEKSDKSASDIEAQNLIEGLKERGIHLMKNESPKKKPDAIAKLNATPDKEVDSSKDIANTSVADNPHERSTTELETELRDTYDTKTFEEYECVIFDEEKKITRTFEDYDLNQKTFIGKVVICETNEVIDIPLVVTPVEMLLNLSAASSQPQKSKGANKKSKDKDKKLEENKDVEKIEANVNVACLSESTAGNDTSREEKDVLEAPSLKKRKLEKEDCTLPEEKECKILLQQINVDTFLNNIYGNS